MFKSNIRHNAGIISHILFEKGKIDFTDICKSTNMEDNQVYLALGWLANEGKIVLSSYDGSLYVEKMQLSTEHFY